MRYLTNAPRLLAIALAAILLSIAPAAAALAHAQIVTTSPAAGSTVATTPTTVSLTFDEPVPHEFAHVVVVGPKGRVASASALTFNDPTITVAVSDQGPGVYAVSYRIVADDGHKEQGSYQFTVGAPTQPQASPSASPSPTTSGNLATTVTVFAVIFFGVALLAVVLFIIVVKRTKSDS